jgi:hypothetical protein
VPSRMNFRPRRCVRHHGVRRDHENIVRGDRHAVLGLHHRHLGMIAQELDQEALVMRVEMLRSAG